MRPECKERPERSCLHSWKFASWFRKCGGQDSVSRIQNRSRIILYLTVVVHGTNRQNGLNFTVWFDLKCEWRNDL